jgi:hypothetical protein
MKNVVAVMLHLVVGSIYAMQEWPSMAIDATAERPEPKILADYHASRITLGYRCFMPKNKEEMNMLYERYKAGKFLNHIDPRLILPSWSHVSYSIRGEFYARMENGDMYYVNKFLEYLEVFVALAVSHKDEGFIGNYLSDYYGLTEDFVQIAWYTSASVVRLEDGKGFDIVTKLNDILNGTGRRPHDEVLDAYFLKYPERKSKKVTT